MFLEKTYENYIVSIITGWGYTDASIFICVYFIKFEIDLSPNNTLLIIPPSPYKPMASH